MNIKENKFSVKNNSIYYEEDKKIPLIVICNILNHLENSDHYFYQDQIPSNHLNFDKIECECCHRKEYGHSGSWNQDPYLFFCSIKCHNVWLEKRMADNNELDGCPFCNQNKLTYVGRADAYFCYGCERWYNPDEINMEYDG